jgi:hypothetical protein
MVSMDDNLQPKVETARLRRRVIPVTFMMMMWMNCLGVRDWLDGDHEVTVRSQRNLFITDEKWVFLAARILQWSRTTSNSLEFVTTRPESGIFDTREEREQTVRKEPKLEFLSSWFSSHVFLCFQFSSKAIFWLYLWIPGCNLSTIPINQLLTQVPPWSIFHPARR